MELQEFSNCQRTVRLPTVHIAVNNSADVYPSWLSSTKSMGIYRLCMEQYTNFMKWK